MMMKMLKWPAIYLILAGIVHVIAVMTMPMLDALLTFPVVAPVLLGFGILTGYRAAMNGGGVGHVLAAGFALGLLPVILDTVAFGMIMGRGVPMMFVGGLAGLLTIVWGALLGGAIGASGK